MAKGETYEEFVEKFKRKKTTDDCYTPEAVYMAIVDWLDETVGLEGRPLVRPFWPGCDYRAFDYPEGCIVVDNPPFSIYSQIVRWFLEQGIDFFLFAPHLTAIVKYADCSYIIANAKVTYENGAVVNTSFVSSLFGDVRIWICPQLGERIEAVQAQASHTSLRAYRLPDCIINPAHAGRLITAGEELIFRKNECRYISDLDGMKELNKKLFGGGFLLNREAEERRREAEERRREAEERRWEAEKRRREAEERRREAEAYVIKLSEREQHLQKMMDQNNE